MTDYNIVMLYMTEKCKYFLIPENVFSAKFVTCGEDAYIKDDVQEVYRYLRIKYPQDAILTELGQLGFVPYVIGQYRLRIYNDEQQDRPDSDTQSDLIVIDLPPEDR